MAPTENAALVEDTIRGFPSRELVRSRAKVWNDSDLDYAFSRVDELTDSSRRSDLNKWLDELRQERADERRHRELMAVTKEAKKKSIQSTPDRPDLVWAVKHLNVAGWIAVVGLCFSSVYVGINLAKVSQVREYFDVHVPPEIQIQRVEVPKMVTVSKAQNPELEKRVVTLFDEHSKRMSRLEGAIGAVRVSPIVPQILNGEKPVTDTQIREEIAAEQRSFAASLGLLEVLAKQSSADASSERTAQARQLEEPAANVTSLNQSGGITAANVNLGVPPRTLNREVTDNLLRVITGYKKVNITCVWGDGEAFQFATAIADYLKARGGIEIDGVNQAAYTRPVIGQIAEPKGDTMQLIIGTQQR